ncbi:MAG: DUF87 domain-containing protein [Clostridia bacterium]|nr:DUF87 domain-containing protein [Clostridia bacterium]
MALNKNKKNTKETAPKKKEAKKDVYSMTKKDKKADNSKTREQKPYNENSVGNRIAPYVFAFFAIFLVITFIFGGKMNLVGKISSVFFGLFGIAMWLVPIALVAVGLRWRLDAPKYLIRFRFICAGLCLVCLSAFVTLVFSPEITPEGGITYTLLNYKENYSLIKFLYLSGTKVSGGGVVGGFLYMLLEGVCGKIGCGILSGLFTVLFLFQMIGMGFRDVASYIVNFVKTVAYDASNAGEQRKEEAEKRRQLEEERAKKRIPAEKKPRTSSVGELDIEDNDDDSDIELEPEATPEKTEKKKVAQTEKPERDLLSDFFAGDEQKAEAVTPESELEPETTGLEGIFTGPDMDAFDKAVEDGKTDSGDMGDIDDIFCDDAVISGAGSTMSAKDAVNGVTSEAPAEPSENPDDVPFDLDDETEQIENPAPDPAEIYEFPPIDLLPGNPNPSVFKVTEELTETAKNLVTTLANFNVRTKVMNISCGPTVTRFELKPEVGVKVRSIQNLADDIALHLRASSVRIEAPIPGKDAVGIEIPNKTVSTVYIKELIDCEEFANLPSRLSVALGMDVSGAPVYMDIAKMPHLLIAGATGMGKSVCINSFIVSVLYKARPDEVKLILIDPKKVEFAMYDSIPHLLVPVVTDPKKAAGSLAWAVNEMEHRFNLIEAAKCRDIKSYNAVCEKDPRFKKMCQIVIIIDELADLMMTARDEVETSICRLAQKARAAGMHLIIGTQRPSVDVITGVIKANVPSRIAFTVASQVDSRTILDTIGAENLVGKGDMLYAPVGCMKPTRVQGSFVGPDSVIEEITDFLRGSGIVAYDDDIQNAIEMEAMKCSEKKKGKGGGSEGAETYVGTTEGFERDEMMIPALELGVDMGQISTSLVQRKLSLGYARAARIVDMLSEMGFVGPFEGSKPRRVLITREEFLEIKNKENAE